MSNNCIVRVKKLNAGRLKTAYEHNERLEHVRNADPERSFYNQELKGTGGRTYKDMIRERIEHLPKYAEHPPRKDAVWGVEVMMTFTPDAADRINVVQWAKDSMDWAASFFSDPVSGKDNLISAVLHMDEQTPHIHAVFIPEVDGGLCAKRLVGDAARLKGMHTSYARAMQAHGLVRGEDNKDLHIRHTRPRDFHLKIDRLCSKNMPVAVEGETPGEYNRRLRAFAEDIIASYETKIDKLEREKKKSPSSQIIRDNVKLSRMLRKIEKDQEYIVREFGSTDALIRKGSELEALKLKIDRILSVFPDDAVAVFVRDQLNEPEMKRKRKEYTHDF